MKGVREVFRNNIVYEVDTDVAEYQGHKWKDLGGHGKRKFETLLFLKDPMAKVNYN